MMGQPVMVKTSEAEKNLAWEAAEQASRRLRCPAAAGLRRLLACAEALCSA